MDVFAFAVRPDVAVTSSRFPRPLITADYGDDGRLVQIVCAGRAAHGPARAVAAVLASQIDDAGIVAELAAVAS